MDLIIVTPRSSFKEIIIDLTYTFTCAIGVGQFCENLINRLSVKHYGRYVNRDGDIETIISLDILISESACTDHALMKVYMTVVSSKMF